MAVGVLYLVAIINWYSRYVPSWRLSNTLDAGFCVEALEETLKKGRPDIFNTERPHQALGYRTPAEVFTSTPLEATSTGMVESLTPDPLRIAVPTLNTTPILP